MKSTLQWGYDRAMNRSLLIPKQVYPKGLRWWCPGIMSCLCRALVSTNRKQQGTVSWRVEWMNAEFLSGKGKQQLGNKRGEHCGNKWDEPNSADPQDASKGNVISLKIIGGDKWDAS